MVSLASKTPHAGPYVAAHQPGAVFDQPRGQGRAVPWARDDEGRSDSPDGTPVPAEGRAFPVSFWLQKIRMPGMIGFDTLRLADRVVHVPSGKGGGPCSTVFIT